MDSNRPADTRAAPSSQLGAMRAVVARARAAQAGWARAPLAARLRVLRAVRRNLVVECDRLVGSVDAALRRPASETVLAEILPLADACRFLERAAPRALCPLRLGRRGRPAWLVGHDAEIRREPLGVVLIVAPGNYPLFLPGAQIVQALAAGNAVLAKSAPGAAAPLRVLAELMTQAGLPLGLVEVLAEDPALVGQALEAGIDRVVLTGSAETGRRVAAVAAVHGVPTTLELSGHDAMFVLPGADMALAAQALAYGLRLNGGATCIAPRRVFVGRDQGPALEEHLVRLVPRIPAACVPTPARVAAERLVEQARGAGARVVARSGSGPGMAAIVLTDLREDDALLRTSVFAPLAVLVPVDGADDALRRAARCPYALGASVFGPEREARAFSARINAGSVTINDVIVPTADPRLSFAARGASGYGATRGLDGLLEMTQVKTVSVRRGRFRPHLRPPDAADGATARALLGLLHGGSRTRWSAAAALVRALLRRVRSNAG